MRIPFYILWLPLFFASCTDDVAINSPHVQPQLSDSLAAYNAAFRFPDSLDKKLVAASFFDQAENANAVIIYSDSYREVAYKLTFLPGRVLRDELRESGHDAFKTLNNNVEFIISRDYVMANRTTGSCTSSMENPRTLLPE